MGDFIEIIEDSLCDKILVRVDDIHYISAEGNRARVFLYKSEIAIFISLDEYRHVVKLLTAPQYRDNNAN